jgi:phage-related protein
MGDTPPVSTPKPKELIWVASSLRDLREFPEDVRQAMGFALYVAQTGGKHVAAKPLRGHRGAGVLEIVDDYDGGTYRTVYTVHFSDAVYVLHAFQKKSKRGAATPKHDLELVNARLALARQLHAKRQAPRTGDQ